MTFPTWREHLRAKAIQMIAQFEIGNHYKKNGFEVTLDASLLTNERVREFNQKTTLTSKEEAQFKSLCSTMPQSELDDEFDADAYLNSDERKKAFNL